MCICTSDIRIGSFGFSDTSAVALAFLHLVFFPCAGSCGFVSACLSCDEPGVVIETLGATEEEDGLPSILLALSPC